MQACLIIVCGYGGVGQIVEHDFNGIVTNPGDLSAFTEALETMVNDRGLREKYAANAKRNFLRDHSYQLAKSKIGMMVNGMLPVR